MNAELFIVQWIDYDNKARAESDNWFSPCFILLNF